MIPVMMTGAADLETRETSGLLLVDKPAGVTSHDIVVAARRAYDQRSIGHLGTLDPFATGLLVLLVGRATRLATFIATDPKTYEATIRFGMETDTDDLTGEVIREAPVPSLEAITSVVGSFTGLISQMPPAYSAKSVDGTRAYASARRGEAVELAPADVRVNEWILGEYDGRDLQATIVCGTGTYVRALARDVGRAAGSAAHLTQLRRVSAGPFHVRDAASVQSLRESPPPLRKIRVVADV
jgi:tRNA pseudouridine55 synthase